MEQHQRRLRQIMIGRPRYRNGKRYKRQLRLKRVGPTSYINTRKCQTSTTTVNGEKIDGGSTINGAASPINQSMNRGASDILQPKFHAAHPKTDGLPYDSANERCRNEFLQYGSGDSRQNMSKASDLNIPKMLTKQPPRRNWHNTTINLYSHHRSRPSRKQ